LDTGQFFKVFIHNLPVKNQHGSKNGKVIFDPEISQGNLQSTEQLLVDINGVLTDVYAR
jgi:hypothetical protein